MSDREGSAFWVPVPLYDACATTGRGPGRAVRSRWIYMRSAWHGHGGARGAASQRVSARLFVKKDRRNEGG